MTNRSADGQPSSTVVPAPQLHQFAQLLFEKYGMPPGDAELLAGHLVWADLRGISWLGMNKIPQYLDRIRGGHTSVDREPTVLYNRAGFLAVDAHDAFGQVVGHRVMTQVIEAARAAGVAVAIVRNTTSAGALGYFATMAVEQRMIGLAINNSPPLQPAPGGAENVVGNQAFAVASPAGRHPPLLLDMATSSITHARIHDYHQRGQLLPEGVALTADGRPTVDPVAALDGMLLPMGGHRGFGLSLLWEVLTGVLAGGPHYSTDVGWPGEADRPQGVSMLLLAIDPTASVPYETFVSRVDDMIDRIHGSKLAAGTDRIMVPGQRSAEIMQRRLADGIPVPDQLLARLRALATPVDVRL